VGALLVCAALLRPSLADAAEAKPPLDFSGTWKLDTSLSVNVSPNMKDAVLIVEQKGEHILVSPAAKEPGRLLNAEEIVVDGRAYEKSVGKGKGIVTARWSADGKALELEVAVSSAEKPRDAVQRSRWTLSADRSTWVRETVTITEGKSRSNRLVFRRQAPESTTTPPPRKS
jgi:hypothetical protein